MANFCVLVKEVSKNSSKRCGGQSNNDGEQQQDDGDDDGARHVTTSSFVLATSLSPSLVLTSSLQTS